MKILIDLPKEVNKELKLYKIEGDFHTLQDATIDALTVFFRMRSEK